MAFTEQQLTRLAKYDLKELAHSQANLKSSAIRQARILAYLRESNLDSRIKKAIRDRITDSDKKILANAKNIYDFNVTSPASLALIHNRINELQNGKCYHCRKKIRKKHVILASSNGLRTKYYHGDCALRLNLI